MKKFLGLEKTQALLKGLTPISYKGKVKNQKAWLKTKRILSENQRKDFAQKKEQHPFGRSPSLHKQECASKSDKQRKESPKEQQETKEKGKGQGKVQIEQALSSELQNFKERKDSNGQCVQYGKNFDEVQKQGGENN
ncbi:hypothetical protein O181_004378 [Austropuccinia psidii MF-1]|uniref:Uncharacterized protein n=1 Tax=Austropuccinia psidii MF-1 TaxID=1389203 RepID=A0A9Q3GEH2_9BASI|nr:hypothetical protein [Austropuccinia psidii MF-1]